jgi:acyl-CoA thioesterase-1
LAARLFNALRRRAILSGWLALAGLIAEPGPAGAASVKILAFGDSLTAGFGLGPDEAFPAKLQAALRAKGYDATVINAGVSGDTTAGGLARLDWALGDKPDYALVELGANDALRGIDPDEARGNLDRILNGLAAAKVKVLLMGMLAPRNWGPDYAQRFDSIYPDLAARHQVPLYRFFLDGVALDPKLNQADMLHPSAAGVDILVARTLPAIERLLGAPGAAPS